MGAKLRLDACLVPIIAFFLGGGRGLLAGGIAAQSTDLRLGHAHMQACGRDSRLLAVHRGEKVLVCFEDFEFVTEEFHDFYRSHVLQVTT